MPTPVTWSRAAGRRIRTPPRLAASRIRTRGGRRSGPHGRGRAAAGRSDLGRRPAARHGRDRRRGHARAAGEALERHRVRARRAAGWSRSSGCGGVGRRRGKRARCPHSRSPSCRGFIAPKPTRGRGCVTSACRTTGSRGSSRGELVTDRGDASGTGYWSPIEERYRLDLLEIVGATWTGSRWCLTCCGPRTAPGVDVGDGTTSGRVRHGRQHGRGAWAPGSRSGEIAMSLGTSGTVYAVSEQATADATGAVAGFADATGRYLPLVCTLNATKVTDAVARVLGVDDDAPRRAGARRAAGRRRRHRAALVRRRAHAEPARRDGDRSAACAVTSLASSSRGPRSRAWCAGCSTASTRSTPPACTSRAPHRARRRGRTLACVPAHRRRSVGPDRRRARATPSTSRRARACRRPRFSTARTSPTIAHGRGRERRSPSSILIRMWIVLRSATHTAPVRDRA